MNWLSSRITLLRRMNWIMTGAAVLLITAGILFIYSTGNARSEQGNLHQKQILWAVFSGALYLAGAAMDYRALRWNAWWVYGLAVVLLIVVLVMGDVVHGARRWFRLCGLGIQPSEFSKLAVILILAWYLARPEVELRRAGTMMTVLLLVGVPLLLVLKEPDLGTALVMIPVAVAMMFVGRVNGKCLAAMAGIGAAMVAFMLGVLLVPAKMGADPARQEQIWKYTGLSEYQRERLLVFFHPSRDPFGRGWNKLQSEIAVGSGGLKGQGYLMGRQKLLEFLPRTVAPTDFIFSVIAEETGFLGSAAILLLFSIIFVGGMRTAAMTRDRLGRLLCVGVVVMLFCHVFVNIAMTVGAMPIAGLPLPLISYGGSFMLTTLVGLGVVQSVHIRRHAR